MISFNGTFILIILSFVVFMLLMKAWYFDPILNIKQKRESKLTDDKNAAQQFADDYERIHAEYQASLHRARKDAHQVIQDLRQKAKLAAQQTMAEARMDAQAETDRQMAELHNWRETTYRQLEAERDALTQAIIAKVTSGNRIRTASGS